MAVQAEPVRRRARGFLEPLRRIALAVQGAAELEHVPDGGGIGLVAAALEGRLMGSDTAAPAEGAEA